MGLQYNIYFGISAIVYMVLLVLYLKLSYNMNSKRNHEFFKLAQYVFLGSVLDVVTAITISYGAVIPRVLNIGLNTAYFFMNAVISQQFLKYSMLCVSDAEETVKVPVIYRVIVHIYYVLLILNLFTGILFDFNEAGAYVHGALFYVSAIVPYLCFVMGVVHMVRNIKSYNWRLKVSILAFSFMALAGGVVQNVWLPDVLLTMFTLSLGLIIVLFSLETPDYQRLMQTLTELQQAKTEAEESKKQAEIASQAKSTFLAQMSHEIRTPINAVLGMNEMILRESEEENILEYAENIQRASRGLLSLINDILDISKIESGKMELVPAEYSLFGLIRDCYNMIGVQMKTKNLEFTIENETKIPNVLYGDEIRIRQILFNLLTNAYKYTNAGGRVTMRIRAREIDARDILLIMSVEDTGRGISEENRKRLFDSFTRVDEQANRNIEGAGLGLSITKNLIELMNGEIGVESEAGQGSLFYVEIPQKIISREPMGNFYERYEETSEEKKHVEKWEAPEGKLLVVDDVQANLFVVKQLLKHTGLQIDTAKSGMECLELTAQKQYHVILLDHMMPEMDGIETLQHLKAQKGPNENTPVVMSTANAISGVKQEYMGAGFTDYLSKPATGKELEDMMLKYLPEELVKEKL